MKPIQRKGEKEKEKEEQKKKLIPNSIHQNGRKESEREGERGVGRREGNKGRMQLETLFTGFRVSQKVNTRNL